MTTGLNVWIPFCSPQTCPWTLRRCQRKPQCWWLCCPLQSKRQSFQILPSLSAAGTPVTELLDDCFPGSSAHTKVKGHDIFIIPTASFYWGFGKDTLMTTENRSSEVAGIFWQAERMSWMVVWRSFRSELIVLWLTTHRCVTKNQINGKHDKTS